MSAIRILADALAQVVGPQVAGAQLWQTRVPLGWPFVQVARVVIETWRHHYNGVHPHDSLRHLTPLEFTRKHPSIPNHQAIL